LFLYMLAHPPNSTLLPYTTLFRSSPGRTDANRRIRATPTTVTDARTRYRALRLGSTPASASPRRAPTRPLPGARSGPPVRGWPRSEEHTSELQSRENLVCRLLLEK